MQKEIKDIERDKASGVTIEVKKNSLQQLLGCVPGAYKHASRLPNSIEIFEPSNLNLAMIVLYWCRAQGHTL